jgi:hypothetical protein
MASAVLLQTITYDLPEAEGSAEAGDASDDAALLNQVFAGYGAFAQRDGGAALERSIDSPMPDVMMGAPFQLSYAPFAADAGVLTPVPALASLAENVDGGSALKDNIWAGFVVMEGPAMLDYFHVHARPVASLDVVVGTFDAPALAIGGTAPVLVLPLAIDGSVLAGPMACTFTTSDATVATVGGKGASAVLTPLAPGSVTVSASCARVSGSTTVTIEPALEAGPDAGEQDGTSAIDGADDIETSGFDDAGDGG